MIRACMPWSEHEPTMMRPCRPSSPQPARQPRLLFALSTSILHWNTQHLALLLSFQISPNIASATKVTVKTAPNIALPRNLNVQLECNFLKYWTCHEKRQLKCTKHCTCHENVLSVQLECDFSKICASDEKCAILSFYPFPLLFFDSTFLLFFYSSFLCAILLYGPFTLLFFDSIFLVLCSSLILPVRATMVLLLYSFTLRCR